MLTITTEAMTSFPIFITFLTSSVILLQVNAASFADLTAAVRRCDTFLDCEENECCVVTRGAGLFGKREEEPTVGVDSVPVDMTTSTEATVTGRPVIGGNGVKIDASDAQILEYLRQLEALRKATEKHNKPNPEMGKALAALSEKSGIKGFLESFNGGFGQSRQKKGICKKLSGEGERCVNYLNGPVCPCGDELTCKADSSFKFGGFGAIAGLHDLVCVPI